MLNDRQYEEKELEKSWLVSYSDLFTLLFVLIVVIAAITAAQIDGKLEELTQAEQAQQDETTELSASVAQLESRKEQLEQEIALLKLAMESLVVEEEKEVTLPSAEPDTQELEELRRQLASALHELNMEAEMTTEGVLIRLPEQILFDSGSAELKPEGAEAIGLIADVLTRFPHLVRIEGYTDDTPIQYSPYAANWELGAARALAVMRQLVEENGLPATRFTIAGWGEANPLVDNASPANRAINRRVEMVILAEVN